MTRSASDAAGYATDAWYTHSTTLPVTAPCLSADAEYDVVVVGAGISGLSSALHLALAGQRVCVLEARRPGWAASGRNGGQVLNGYACDISTLTQLVGDHTARQLWDLSVYGVELTRQLIEHWNIECELGHGVVNTAIKTHQKEELWHVKYILETTYRYPHLQWLEGDSLRQTVNSPRYQAGLLDTRAFHLHPLKYTLGLAAAARQAGVTIYENSRAIDWQRQAGSVTVRTQQAQVRARHLVFCGNTALNQLVPAISRRIMPVGTYIAATPPLGAEQAAALIPGGTAVCDTNFVLDYFRLSSDHRLLFGGMVSYSNRQPWRLAPRMRQRIHRVFPQLQEQRIEYAWGGNVDITMNRAPDFGQLYPEVFYVQGFSGHGLALTTLAGKLVCDAITGHGAEFDLYRRIPHRSFPGGRWLRTPLLVMAMAWYRLNDFLR